MGGAMFNRSRSVYSKEKVYQKSSKPAHSRGVEVLLVTAVAVKDVGGGRGENINTSRFINKTAVNCSVEHLFRRINLPIFRLTRLLKKRLSPSDMLLPRRFKMCTIPHILKAGKTLWVSPIPAPARRQLSLFLL